MNKFIACALMAFSFAVASVKAAEVKIATIDIQSVFKDYYKTQEAEQRLQSDTTKYRTDYDGMMEDYRKLMSQANDQSNALKDSTLSESAKKEKQNKLEDLVGQIRNKEQEIKNYEQTTARLMQDQSQRTRKSIIDEITKTIDTYCKGKYTIVLDKSGMNLNGTPTILYSEGLPDITADITKQLNAAKPASTSATGTAAKPASK